MTTKMETAKSVLSTVGSVAAATMVARSIINDFLPGEVHDYLFSGIKSFFSHRFSSEITMIIDEFQGLENNQIFEAAELYLGARTKPSTSSTPTSTFMARCIKVSKPEKEKAIQVSIERDEEVVDEFEGIKFRWVLHCHKVESKNHFYNPRDLSSTLKSEVRSFHLSFHKTGKIKAMDVYLPHVLKQAELLKQATKTVKLFTMDCNDSWDSITLNHPATFETLAVDDELKQMIVNDLDRFLRRKEYYRRVGKAWKRGYLLYGPPGTGKSSLITAMANYLNFDIYDLQLAGVQGDSELRSLLLGTTNRSILVVEDIDCSIDLKNREAAGDVPNTSSPDPNQRQVTLSGLLNSIDGLWSSCGDERIIIFTTNHKDKLDPALLRPGRMDMHIHMSYCTPGGFKILAKNYLGIKHHEVFVEVERLIEEVEITPAEVAEQLIKHDDPDPALRSLIEFLKSKKIENEEAMAKKSETEIKSEANDGKVEELHKNDVEGETATTKEPSVNSIQN